MFDGSLIKNGEIGRAAPDVDHDHPQFLFVGGQHRFAGRQLLQNDVLDAQAGLVDAFDDVLRRRDRGGDDVHLRFQPDPRHAQRSLDAVLVVHDVFLRKHVDDFPVQGNGDGLGGFDHPFHIFLGDLLALGGDDPVTVQAVDVAAGDAHEHRVDLASRHEFRLFDGAFDRFHGAVDVHHHALAQAAGRGLPQADDVDLPFRRQFPDDAADLGRADIQPDDVMIFLGHSSSLTG